MHRARGTRRRRLPLGNGAFAISARAWGVGADLMRLNSESFSFALFVNSILMYPVLLACSAPAEARLRRRCRAGSRTSPAARPRSSCPAAAATPAAAGGPELPTHNICLQSSEAQRQLPTHNAQHTTHTAQRTTHNAPHNAQHTKHKAQRTTCNAQRTTRRLIYHSAAQQQAMYIYIYMYYIFVY